MKGFKIKLMTCFIFLYVILLTAVLVSVIALGEGDMGYNGTYTGLAITFILMALIGTVSITMFCIIPNTDKDAASLVDVNLDNVTKPLISE